MENTPTKNDALEQEKQQAIEEMKQELSKKIEVIDELPEGIDPEKYAAAVKEHGVVYIVDGTIEGELKHGLMKRFTSDALSIAFKYMEDDIPKAASLVCSELWVGGYIGFKTDAMLQMQAFRQLIPLVKEKGTGLKKLSTRSK